MGRWGDTFIDGILGAKDKITVGEKKYLVATTDYGNKVLLLGDPNRNATLRGITVHIDASEDVGIYGKRHVEISSADGNTKIHSSNIVLLDGDKYVDINTPAIKISNENYGTEDPSTKVKNPITGQIYFKIVS